MNRRDDSGPAEAPDEEDGDQSGVEIEREEPGLVIERPFDPEKIRVKTKTVLVDSIVSRISHGEIDLAPDFHRAARIWNVTRKARLIESLLLRIPLPAFYVAADVNENWSVVDGLQRMTTISDFVRGEFPLSDLEYLTQFNGLRFYDLPRPMQRRISETELVFHVIEPGTAEEVTLNIFSRINAGGLNGQEIRHALHKGPVRDFLRRLSQTKEFLDATGRSIRVDRMADRECVLRFLAFRITPWEEYRWNELDCFLSNTMEMLNQMPEVERYRLEVDFRRSMQAAYAIFDEGAFRRRALQRSPINKALFDAWSVALARCNDDDLARLIDIKDKVKEEYSNLILPNPAFDVSISYSTGAPQRVSIRFGMVDGFIRHVLGKNDDSKNTSS